MHQSKKAQRKNLAQAIYSKDTPKGTLQNVSSGYADRTNTQCQTRYLKSRGLYIYKRPWKASPFPIKLWNWKFKKMMNIFQAQMDETHWGTPYSPFKVSVQLLVEVRFVIFASDNGKDWEYLLPFHTQRERVEYFCHSVLWPWLGRYFLPVHIQKGERNSTQSMLRHWIRFFPFLETGFENQEEKFESNSDTAQ